MSRIASLSDGRSAPLVGRRLQPRWFLLAGPLLVMAALYVLPLASLLGRSFWADGLTLKYYVEVFTTPAYFRILLWTLQLAFVTMAISLVLGYPVAYLMATGAPRTRLIIVALVVLPFWTSGIVRAYAWIALLGRGGIVNTLLTSAGVIGAPLPLVFNAFGLYVGTVHIMLPYMILSLYSVMSGLDRNLVRAAHTLGAGPARAFLRIFLPLSLPGIVAGGLLVFVLSLGFFITPAILGGLRDETFVMLIERQMNELLNWRLASALAVVLLAVTLVIYCALARFFALEPGLVDADRHGANLATALQHALTLLDDLARRARRLVAWRTRAPEAGPTTTAPSRPLYGGHAVKTATWLIVTLMVVPIAVIVLVSFSASHNLEFPPRRLSLHWFVKYFSRPEWLGATLTSFQVALMASVFSTALGLLAALGLLGMGRRGRTALFALLLSPMIMPAIVYAVAIYFLFAGLNLVGTRLGMALAHTILVLPGVVLVIYAALQGLDPSLQRAAASLGAGPLRRFVRVTLPLIAPAVLAAGLLAFLTSFDEVVIAIFLSGTTNVTLPKKMYESIRFDTDPTITAASAVLIAFTLAVLTACELLRRRQALGGERSAAALRG